MEHQEPLFKILRDHKLRLTKTRKAIVNVLSANRMPLPVSELLRAMEKIGVKVNKTTVYRELERLQKLSVISSVQLGDRKQFYELAHREHHHHLVCVKCETVKDVGVDEKKLLFQEHKLSGEKKFMVLRHSLEFFGLCAKCQSA